MGKKAKYKALRAYAKTLEPVEINTVEKHLMKGSEILEWGTITELDGKPIEPEKFYLYNAPVIMQKNEYRSLKRALVKNGKNGLAHALKNHFMTTNINKLKTESL